MPPPTPEEQERYVAEAVKYLEETDGLCSCTPHRFGPIGQRRTFLGPYYCRECSKPFRPTRWTEISDLRDVLHARMNTPDLLAGARRDEEEGA